MISTKTHSIHFGFLVLLFFGILVSCRTATSGASLQQQLMKHSWGASQLMGVALDVEDPSISAPSLKFESGGRISGSTGCNTFMGTYTITGDKVTLDPGALTKKYCEGDREQKFLEAIRKTTNLRLSGQRIDLVDDREVVLMQLKPKN